MTVYVDQIFIANPRTVQARQYGQQWCHLFCDGNLEELHQFAQSIGLKREWFQRSSVPHYDLTPAKRQQAINAGAIDADFQTASPIRRYWMKQWRGGDPVWESSAG